MKHDSSPDRDKSLIELSKKCRLLDSTRLITSVINDQQYKNNTIRVWDTLYKYFDVMSINEYLGWYVPWQGRPADTKWEFVYQKPVYHFRVWRGSKIWQVIPDLKMRLLPGVKNTRNRFIKTRSHFLTLPQTLPVFVPGYWWIIILQPGCTRFISRVITGKDYCLNSAKRKKPGMF